MRIAHLITRLDRGGSAVNTLLCAIEQARRGARVCVVHGPLRPDALPAAERAALDRDLVRFAEAGGERIELATLVREPAPARDIAAGIAIRRALRAFGPTIVHTHTSKAGALGRLAARGLGAPVVHTPHGHVFGGYFPRWKERVFLAVERRLAPLADRLIALTRTERDEQLALGIGRAEQWRIVPSGVDVDAIERRVQALRTDRAAAFLAVSVGRLVPVKGMDRLLRVWAEVVRRRPGARLAIVGEGPQRAALAALAGRLGIAAQVRLVGFDDPLPWLARARMFVLFSRNEGQGRALVEAMAAGLPAVVGGAPALAEVAGEAGRVVDPDDPPQAAEALLAPWPADAADKARAQAQRYGLRAMLTALEGVYAELVA